MKIYFYTSGCKVNQYETQVLIEQFGPDTFTENIHEADTCIINSCTVTHNADADCRQAVRKCLRENPAARIIVTGCSAVSSADEISKLSPRVIICPNKKEIAKILAIPVEHKKTDTITSFHKHSRAFVKIQDGCDAFCSYCIVPHVRSTIWSKPKETVMQEIEVLVKNGYTGIVLCGIRLGKYNEGGFKLVNLIKSLLGKFNSIKIYFSSFEILEINSELLDLMANSQQFERHFHIPLQSGDDEILKKMKRPYTTAQFEQQLTRIYAKLPDVKITSDVIVGFPGETVEQFNNTLEFVKHNKFSKLHVFRYSPRKGTPASLLPGRIDPSETKRRAKLLLNF
ncbi:MAG: hypothetical protein A2252_02095 [Elusimicrobia bacterium RIFOXYA2_FULL_39_19]|nr:MAG: hypothetical protein A2252_02095 [Elusimicrobia bacterium RIFOXYA2_FULL_39_19]